MVSRYKHADPHSIKILFPQIDLPQKSTYSSDVKLGLLSHSPSCNPLLPLTFLNPPLDTTQHIKISRQGQKLKFSGLSLYLIHIFDMTPKKSKEVSDIATASPFSSHPLIYDISFSQAYNYFKNLE